MEGGGGGREGQGCSRGRGAQRWRRRTSTEAKRDSSWAKGVEEKRTEAVGRAAGGEEGTREAGAREQHGDARWCMVGGGWGGRGGGWVAA